MSRDDVPVELHITSVYYEQKHRNSNYGHEVIGATAYINEWEEPEKALEMLRGWVNDHLGLSQRAVELQQSCETLRQEEVELLQAVSMMRNRYEKARVFLEKIGVPVPTSWHDEQDLPF